MERKYMDIIDGFEQNSDMLNEATVEYAVETISAVNSKHSFMHDFVYSNYDREEAEMLEEQNFMIGKPFVFDTVDSADDWDRIEQEAEASGEASADQVKRVFDRWHNL